jgi:hypothetical protein
VLATVGIDIANWLPKLKPSEFITGQYQFNNGRRWSPESQTSHDDYVGNTMTPFVYMGYGDKWTSYGLMCVFVIQWPIHDLIWWVKLDKPKVYGLTGIRSTVSA